MDGEAPITNPPATGRVLLVEDDPDHAELVTRAMGEVAPGLEITRVSDGEAALRELATLAVSSTPPVLVLLDLRLPGMDGTQVLGRIRADPVTHDLPVVLLTTAEPADTPGIGGDPRTRRVVKPIDGGSFRRLIGEVVGHWLGEGGDGSERAGSRSVAPSPSV